MREWLKTVKQIDFAAWPLILILVLTPLYLRMAKIVSTPLESSTFHRDFFIDLFAYARGQFFVTMTVLAVMVLLVSLVTKDIRLRRDWIFLAPVAMMVMAVVAYFNALDKIVASRGSLDHYEGVYVIMAYAAVFIVAYHVAGKKDQARSILKVFVAASIIPLLIGLLQAFGFNVLNSPIYRMFAVGAANFEKIEKIALDSSSIYSVFSNPNYVGNFTVLVLPLAVFFLLKSRTVSKWFYGTIASLCVVVTYSAQSLGGMLALSLVIIISYFTMGREGRGSRVRIIVSIVAGYAVSLAFQVFNNAMDKEALATIAAVLLFILFTETLLWLTENKRQLRISLFTGVGTATIIAGVWLAMSVAPLYETGYYVKDIITDKSGLKMEYIYKEVPHTASFTYQDPQLIMDLDGQTIRYDHDTEELFKGKPEYEQLSFLFGKFDKYNIIRFTSLGCQFVITEKGSSFVGDDKKTQEIVHPSAVPIGGFERLGSGRAYIWSRSLPLILKNMFIGAGPDNFPFEFPQQDIVGKMNMGFPLIVVDKPHNWYLQSAINIGGLYLLCILTLITCFTFRSARLLKSSEITVLHPLFTTVVAYHVIQMFNDSTLAGAPLFWVIYGLAFGIIYSEMKGHTQY